MKNFRKVLALVLVVATLFSFTAMAGAANSYEDADEISYTEAVTVLSHVGVLEGYEVAEDEYEFKPTNTISREEMAKMIAVMANAGDDVSTLYASACTFADVAKDRWSASYVAYCAKTGIVAGRSATTFDPTGKVTGLETAKMLLVTLGFDADEQGYVGADWKVNVLRDAKTMGLLNNFAAGYDVEAAITREEAAQMMLNALETNVVIGYLSDAAKVIVTNKAYNSLSNLAWTLVDAKGVATLYGKVVISDDTLGEALFGLKRMTTADRDCYGRPATSWKYTTVNGTVKTIGVYANAPVFESYNTTAAKVKTATASYATMPAQLWVNGVQNATVNTVEAALAALDIGKGTQVEVYLTANDQNQKYVVFVVINTYIAKIDQVNTASHTVDFDDWDGTNFSESTKWNVVNEWGLTPANEGDVVLLWICGEWATATTNGVLHDLKVIEPTVATVTSADTYKGQLAKSTFVASGETYEYAHNKSWGNVTAPVGDAASYIGEQVAIYTDLNGYVMAIDEYSNASYGYAVIDNASVEKVLVKEVQGVPYYSYTANLINFEANPAVGEDVAVDVSFYNVDIADIYNADTLVKYTTNAKGQLTVVNVLEGFNSVTAFAGQDPAFSGKGAAGVTLSKYASVTNLPGGTISDDTQILVRVYDWVAGAYTYKYFDGKSAVDATYVLDYVQYFTDEAGYVTYMYGDATYAATNVKAYVLSYAKSTIYLTGEGQTQPVAYDVYDVLVNGEPAKLAVSNEQGTTLSDDYNVYTLMAKCLGKTTLDGDTIYIAASAPDVAVANGTFDVSNNTIRWTGVDAKALDLDPAAKINVCFKDGWDHDNKASTTALTYITVSQDQLANYVAELGWTNGDAWAYDTDDDGYMDVVYINNGVDVDAYN